MTVAHTMSATIGSVETVESNIPNTIHGSTMPKNAVVLNLHSISHCVKDNPQPRTSYAIDVQHFGPRNLGLEESPNVRKVVRYIGYVTATLNAIKCTV